MGVILAVRIDHAEYHGVALDFPLPPSPHTIASKVMPHMPQTAFCYHCGTHHPIENMRQIETKGGKRWRCVRSIEATKNGAEARVAFGRQTTAVNKSIAQAGKDRMTNPERDSHK